MGLRDIIQRGVVDGVRGSIADHRNADIETFDELLELEQSERFKRCWSAYLNGRIESLPTDDQTWFWWMRRQRIRLLRERQHR